MIIGVDVDQTIVDTQPLWENWLEREFKVRPDNGWSSDFNHDVFLEWWKNPELYDDLLPYPDAIVALNLLAINHKLWFITKCFDEHIESKLNFCHRFFKVDRFFNSNFNKSTAFDGVIHYMVDDRPSILTQFKQTKCYRINTTTEELTDEFPLMSWQEIYIDIETKRLYGDLYG